MNLDDLEIFWKSLVNLAKLNMNLIGARGISFEMLLDTMCHKNKNLTQTQNTEKYKNIVYFITRAMKSLVLEVDDTVP